MSFSAEENRLHELAFAAIRAGLESRSGRPVAAVIPVPVYERLVAERQTRFEVIERVRSRLPKTSPEELETDVREAVAKVRSRHASGRS